MNYQGPCTVCKKSQGVYYVLDLDPINGTKQEYFLCSKCAKKTNIKTPFKVADVFMPFSEVVCDFCGLDQTIALQVMRLGCAHDYDLFGFEPIVAKIHRLEKVQHVGKVPKIYGDMPPVDVKKLETEMDAAIKAENYERAAELRDEIKRAKNV